jgi:translation elongation factor EF-Tu-like GTPase
MKVMSPVCNEKERIAYVRVVMKSEIHGIELVARMVGRNDVGDESSRLLMLPKVIDEQDVECGIVLTQPLQES